MNEQEIKTELNRLNQKIADKGYAVSSVTIQLSSHGEECSVLIYCTGFTNYRTIIKPSIRSAFLTASQFIDNLPDAQVAA